MKVKPVESSMINSVGYDKPAKALHIEFNTGSKYVYSNVPVSKYRALMKATSKGKYLNKNVKPKHPYTKLEEQIKEARLAGFLDELEKLSEVRKKDVHAGVPITSDYKELVKTLQPGDVLATKPNNFKIDAHLAQLRQFIGGSPRFKWDHIAMYAGDKRLIHATKPIRVQGPPQIRDQTLDLVNSKNYDVYVLRPKATESVKKQAVENAKKALGLPYSMRNFFATALGLPIGNTPIVNPTALTCPALVSYSYPELEINQEQKSRHQLLPVDIVNSEDFTPVLAYSNPKSLK